MTYYQILRQRRLDLKLSIQDVSSQTRLAPEYIQAIEMNNLEVFSDDFSFVRYFVRAYCDAIGVNWQAVQAEVDANINAYAHQRNMALTQAQKRMVASMPSGQGRKIKRSKHSNFQKRITRLSRNLKWSRKRLIRVGIIAGVLIFGLLFVVNLGLDYYSSQQALQEEANRKAELAEKEAETERLAQQRQQEVQKEDIVIENTDTNTYTITNVLENSTPLELEITLPLDSTVVIYNDGEVITGDTSTIYSDTFKKEITVDKECTLEIEIGSYSGNQFSVNGNNLAFDENYWYPGEPAYLDIIIKANEQTGE